MGYQPGAIHDYATILPLYMKPQIKIYITLTVGLVILAIAASAVWSGHKIAELEDEVERAKRIADDNNKKSTKKEAEAAEYVAKIDYLERQLADIQTTAKKQDEELKITTQNTNNARRDVGRTRRIRSVDTSAAELCQKLTEVGHGCEE